MIDLVLGDDHVVFLDALGTVLTGHGYLVAGTARTVPAVISTVGALRPDLCLLDRRLADGDGIEAVTDVLRANSQTKVVMLTADREMDTVSTALERGAVGYVHKTRGAAALVDAIQRVLAGEIVVDLPTGAPPRRAVGVDSAHRMVVHLTRRERQCLTLLVDGLSTAAMARRLGVGSATVRSHIQSLFTKLNAHSRLEVAAIAVRMSLLDEPDGDAVPRLVSGR